MLKKKFKFLLIVFFFILVEFFLYYRFELINLRDLYNFPDTEAKNNIIKKYQAKYEKTSNVEFYNEKVALYDGKYLNLVPKEDFSKISQPTCLLVAASLVTSFIFAIFINSLEVLNVRLFPVPITENSIPEASN